MINVEPGRFVEFHNTDKDIERIVADVTKLIQGASPFVNTVEVLNKTKSCTVDIVFEGRKMQIIFRNPKDAEFDLNYLETPVTPVQITGR